MNNFGDETNTRNNILKGFVEVQDFISKAKKDQAEKSDLDYDEVLKKADDKQKEKMNKVMGEFKDKKLKSSSGETITDQKQAIAIAYSEAGIAKKKK